LVLLIFSKPPTPPGKNPNSQIRKKKKAVIRKYGSPEPPVEGEGVKISASFTRHSCRTIRKISHSQLQKLTSPSPLTGHNRRKE